MQYKANRAVRIGKGYDVAKTANLSKYDDANQISSYAKTAVAWANAVGLVSGTTDTTLVPKGNATRAQIATVLMRFCENVVPQLYAVIFDYNYSNKGTYKTVSVESGKTATRPLNPSRNGYEFGGWYTSGSGDTAFDFTTAISQNITLYAHWAEVSTISHSGGGNEATTYTINFDSNGGSEVPSQHVQAGKFATQPEEPAKENYNFEGWYSDSAFTTAYDFTKPVTSNVTLYAKWEESKSEYEQLIESQSEELKNIQLLNGGTLPEMTLDTEDFIPNAILGTFSDTLVTDASSAIEALGDIEHLMQMTDAKAEFEGTSVQQVGDTSYVRLQQVYNGVRVYGKELIVSANAEGNIQALTGNYDPISGTVNTVQNLTMSEAYDIAVAHSVEIPSEGELIIYALEDNYDEYAWLFQGTDTVIVSAVDGTILASWTNVNTTWTAAKGTGRNERNETVTFQTVLDDQDTEETEDDRYLFVDSIRNIYYKDMESNDSDVFESIIDYQNQPTLTDDDNVWTGVTNQKAITLQENLTKAYDYYLQAIGLQSYDGNGGIIYAYVNDLYDSGNNAYNNGPYATELERSTFLSFGKNADYHERLDVVCHEFTHAIQRAIILGMVYKNESGALMEAYSDIAGELAQLYWNDDNPDWMVGTFRNIKSPEATGNPKTYHGANWGNEVHQNSTVISHVFYLLYTAGLNDVKELTELLYRAWHYLSANATFWDYRIAILAAANDMNLTTGEKQAIELAFDMAQIQPRSYDQRLAFSRLVVHVEDLNGNSIQRAGINVRKIITSQDKTTETVVAQGYTDENGNCSIDLRYGEYIYTVTAPECKPFLSENCVLSENKDYYVNVKLWPAVEQEATVCILGGMVTDALTGNAIPDVTLTFRKGIDVTSGRATHIATTDSNGKYRVSDLDYGHYTVVAYKNGYIANTLVTQVSVVNWQDAERDDYEDQNIALSPSLTGDEEYRIVLTWGETPKDLDSHFNATTIIGSPEHVYYAEQSGLTANLDRDDRDSYGPETITVTDFGNLADGFTYSVHDYTNRATFASSALSKSEATVSLYRGTILLKTYYVPTQGYGTVWNVFSMDTDGKIKDINTFTYTQNPEEVGFLVR